MKHEFENLRSDAIVDAVGLLASPAAMRLVLRKLEPVAAVRAAFARKEITQVDIDEFLDLIRREFQKGMVTSDDVALAALATALEDVQEGFADEYLRSLARLRIAELPNARRVAAECLRAREERAAQAEDPEELFIHTGEFVMPEVHDAVVLIWHRLGDSPGERRERVFDAVRSMLARFEPRKTRLTAERFEDIERKEVEIRREHVRKALARQ